MNSLQILLEKYPDKSWLWHGLSANPNITWEFIEANPDKPWWWWDYLSKNHNITWEIVEANPGKPWMWDYLSNNPIYRGSLSMRTLTKIGIVICYPQTPT